MKPIDIYFSLCNTFIKSEYHIHINIKHIKYGKLERTEDIF